MLLTFVRQIEGSVDPVNDVSSPSDVTYTAEAIILPAPRSPNLSFVENTRIQQDYRKLLLAGKDCGLEPASGDVTTFEGVRWVVSGYTRLAPDGGPAILYTVLCERATQ